MSLNLIVSHEGMAAPQSCAPSPVEIMSNPDPQPANEFANLGLPPQLLRAVEKAGFTQPTPIQSKAIPLVLAGKDVIGSAQTGTGKTAAFALPILTKLAKHAAHPRVLILEPTRELAAQVEEAIRDLAQFTGLRVSAFFGGVGYGRQTEALHKGVDIMVATPGRLQDLMERGTCSLNHVQYLVLDEADRMLDMGFLPDVKRIVQRCPKQRQTCLFSATIPPEINALIHWAMKEPETIEIGARRSPASTVKHVVYPVAEAQKPDLLCALLDQVHWESVIVFCRTKRRADRIGQMLKRKNHSVAVLHADRPQRERERALSGFRSGHYEVLVATDIAARGLDIADVSHVINYDVPQHAENYVHRIGRTGRAEATGDAFTLMVAEDARLMAAIERYIGQPIEHVKLEGYDYTYTALFEAKKKGAEPMRARGARVRGGYFYGPSRSRRR
jgi:ATP-dependent RNA helicase RhlE